MNINALILTFIIICIVGFFYFLPSIIARKKRDALSIFFLNLFLGATGIGWVIALVWACRRDVEPTIIYVEKNDEPALNPAISNFRTNNKPLKLDETFNPITALIKIVITVVAVIALIALITFLSK